MFTPTLDEVREYANHYSMIPLIKTIHADMETPIRLYSRIKEAPYSFLLESVEGGVRWSRYSIIGTKPFQVIKGNGDSLTVIRGNTAETIRTHEPFALLKRWMDDMRSPSIEGLPPFLGGVIGYVGYEAVRFLEPRRPVTKTVNEKRAYDFHLMWLDRVMVYDHLKQHLLFVKNLRVPVHAGGNEIDSLYRQGIAELDRWAEEILRTPVLPEPPIAWSDEPVDLGRLKANLSHEQYMNLVEKAKEHIRNGEVYQVVLSRLLTFEPAPDPFSVYRILRVLNPSPYMYVLKLDDEVVVGTSPELLVKVNGRKAYLRPIAGSRPRGSTPDEDERLERELIADEKERAEHVMLVDLGRNDLGRIAQFHTVELTDFMKIEKYSHIMHLVSQVEAVLREEIHPMDAFFSGFPAGTLTGAPKIRAMEVIAELEPDARGVYGGAIGAFSFTGDLDSCIAIRTIQFKDGKAHVQSGGGIVHDSVPEMEFMETVNKAMGMLKALQMASVEVGNLSCS